MLVSFAPTRSRPSTLRCFGRNLQFAVAWLIAMLALAGRSTAQIIPPITTALPNAEVWVHPTDGVNPATADDEALYINDPSLKFKTLQAAIDAMQRYLAAHYVVPFNPAQEGIVYALPGLYGPFSVHGASGDVLPIVMRERVHVQGAGARQCVIRGASTMAAPAPPNTSNIVWPVTPFPLPSGAHIVSKEVLVTYQFSSPDDLVPQFVGAPIPGPWRRPQGPYFDSDNVAEVLDSFSFFGGDVQVLIRYSGATATQPTHFAASRISNCIFDLRHNWKPEAPFDPDGSEVSGPSVAIHMSRRSTCTGGGSGQFAGYLDGRTLIAHNTFIFARWKGPTSNDWDTLSRDEAVGILDVTNPNCSDGACSDGDHWFKGVGNACIVSNIFRTRPQPAGGSAARPFAMIGIDQDDTLVNDGLAFVQTNMFDPSRVGATNAGTSGQGFYSIPVRAALVESVAQNNFQDLWNCQPFNAPGGCPQTGATVCNVAPNPVPAEGLALWDGANGVDPAFVGEYAATTLVPLTGALVGYRDWRVLPGSPVENRGVAPEQRYFVTAVGAFVHRTNEPPELDLFKWDGERWGNPRVVGEAPDVGFDERHLMIEVGNWANESNSHNVSGFMHPSIGNGNSRRYFVLPRDAGNVQLWGSNRWLRLHDTLVDPPFPSAGDGWVTPPGALLNPPSLPSLPKGYRTKYVSYANAPFAVIPLPTASFAQWDPLGRLSLRKEFLLVHLDDPECGPDCKHSYFNLQGLIVDDDAVPPGGPLSAELLRSNMQGEYR